MISNVVSYIPTILGLAWSGTTAVPVIECAVRAIWHFGELSANRAQYHTCTINSLYVEEKNQFIKDIEADFNSKLPSSCLPDVTQPDAPKLKLKFVNSEDPLLEDNLDVDLETSKLFCGTIKDFLNDNPDATEYLIPYFSEKNKMFTDDILKNYLTDRSKLNLTTLNDEVLLEVYDLARCLNMPDLEAKCMVTIVERFIKTESPVLKDGLTGLDHHYKKKFNRLFDNVEELKTGHLSKALLTRKKKFDNEKTKVVKIIAKTALFGLFFTPMPFMPLILTKVVFNFSPDISSYLISTLAHRILPYYIMFSALVLIQHGAPIMPTTHHVISQIYQKFGNCMNIIYNTTCNAIVFTASKIKDGTIFIALSIIHAPVYLYYKIGQGLQQIPTAVTTGLIASTVLLVAAKQFG